MIRISRASSATHVFLLLVLLGGGFGGCTDKDEPLAPYDPGTVSLTELIVEDSVYVPRISWGGGYVSALGVNRGSSARLDTSLIWLVHKSSNGIPYQQRFGQLPAGGEDLTTGYGGQPASVLQEDQLYTFWVAKEEIWSVIAANPGKTLRVDSSLTVPSRTDGDTLYLHARSFNVAERPIDLWIGIRNVRPVGRLGVMDVIQTNTSNAPIIRWTIAQAGQAPPDTLIANVGIAGGATYDVMTVVWEVLAVDTSTGQRVYWNSDIIVPPVVAGQHIPGTDVFTAFPATGLQRNATYYVWIANKAWDQRNRSRTAFNYASATFETY